MSNEKINVLMVGNSKSVKGGITTVITQFLNHKWNKNIKMKFIPTYIEKNNICKILFFLIASIRIIMYFIFQNKKDKNIVHIHMSYKGSFTRALFISRISKIFKNKVIVHLHGSEFEKWYNLCENSKKKKIRGFLKECDSFIVLGEEWKKKIKKIEPDTNIKIVKNSINIPKEVSKYNLPFSFLFVGVLIKRKGVNDLIDAVNQMYKNNEIKNVKFVIVGSGEEEKKLIEIIEKNGLNDFFEFKGWVENSQISTIFKKSNAFILPSYNEGLPMAILEAISYGLPIISTEVGDISSAVMHEKNGFLYKPGDIDSLKKYIKTMLCMNNEEWNIMSDFSRKKAIEEFSIESYFMKIEKLYFKEV